MDALKEAGSKHAAGKLEQKLAVLRSTWQRQPLAIRILQAAAFIIIAGLLSPTYTLNGYKIVICNFAIGASMAICIFGGPEYAIATFLGMLFFNYTQHTSAFGDNYIVVSIIDSFIGACAGWFAMYVRAQFDTLRSTADIIKFLALVSLLSALLGLGTLLLSVHHGHIALADTNAYGVLFDKLSRQDYAASILGTVMCLAIFGTIGKLTTRKLAHWLRLASLWAISFIYLTAMFYIQSVKEMQAAQNRLDNAAQEISRVAREQYGTLNEQVRNISIKLFSRSRHDDLNVNRLHLAFSELLEQRQGWIFLAYCQTIPSENDASSSSAPADRVDYQLVALQSQPDVQFVQSWLEGRNISLPPSLQASQWQYDYLDSWRNPDLHNYHIPAEFLDVFCVPNYENGELQGLTLAGIDTHLVSQATVEAIASNPDLSWLGLRVYSHQGGEPDWRSRIVASIQFPEAALYRYTLLYRAQSYGQNSAILTEYTSVPAGDMPLLNSFNDYVFYCLIFTLACALGNVLLSQNELINEEIQSKVKELADNEYLNTLVMESVRDAIITTNRFGFIITVNEATCELTGRTREELIGQHIHPIAHSGMKCIEDSSCQVANYFKRLNMYGILDRAEEKKLRHTFTEVFVDGNDQVINVECSISVMTRANHQKSFVLTTRNIQKEIALQKMRSNYLASLSHEMRTPLSCIKGTVDMLIKYSGNMIKNENEFTETGLRMLEVARRNVSKLSQLIGDVLLSDSVENDNLHIQTAPHELAPIFSRAVENLRSTANEADIEIHLGTIEGCAQVDELRLEQVLNNLITNAIKYTPAGGHIYLETRIDKEKHMAVCSVRDTGIGIPADKTKVIFNRFAVTNDDSIRKRGGMGLGLSICRGLVRAHGGKIWAESQENHGSTFYFTLPLCNKNDNAAGQDAGAADKPHSNS